MSKRLKKIMLMAVAAAAALYAIESTSSYVLYRYYSSTKNDFRPMGSATLVLIERLLMAAHRERRRVVLSIDHGMLFGADDTLGYRLLPGDYQVTERFDNLVHEFHIKVNDQGHRVTSYVPVHAEGRILFTGDSSIFGLGVDDEQTIPWLMQTRLPNYEVVNLSVSSYSTIQALLQLRQMAPAVGKGDIVLLVYHPVSNGFNVESLAVLETIRTGFELQLGDPAQMRHANIPFGTIDDRGALSIRRVELFCQPGQGDRNCVHPDQDKQTITRITELAFDEILALNQGQTAVLFVSGVDSDPVIAHLRAKGVLILDVRTSGKDPEDSDLVPTDGHAGPFWHHAMYLRLMQALQSHHIVD